MTGKELRQLRKRLRLTQTKLAAKVGVHPITVSKWERDVVRMSAPTAKLLRLLGKVGRRR